MIAGLPVDTNANANDSHLITGQCNQQVVRGRAGRLEAESLLGWWRRREAAFQLEHPLFGRRAAGCGEAAELAAGREHPMARNDQRHRILRHRLADAASNFGSRADLFRERAVRRGVTPAHAARSCVDLFEERILSAEIELKIREIDLLASEVTLCGFDRSRDVSGRRSRLSVYNSTPQIVLSRFRRTRRQHETRDARVAPRDPAEAGCGLEHEIVLCRLIHGSATVSARRIDNNPIIAMRRALTVALP